MVELLVFSDEILLSIAYHLRYHPSGLSTAYAGLRQLSLTCQRLRRIAQEVLFQNAAIPRSHSTLEESGLTSLSLFVRSVLEHDDLADKVKALEIEAVNPSFHKEFERCIENEETSHGETCACGWTTLAPSVEAFINSNPSFRRLKLRRSSWWTQLSMGNQSLLVGLLLRRIRTLCSLSLDIYASEYSNEFRSQCIYRTDLFGYLLLEPNFTPALVPGLANLTSFSSTNVLAPDFIELPHLCALQIGLDHDRHWATDPKISLWHKPPGFQLSDTITRLTVILSITDFLRPVNLEWKSKYRHLNLLINSLPNLTHLSVRFTKPDLEQLGDPNVRPTGSYDHILPVIASPSVQSLTLDTTDLGLVATRDWDVEFAVHFLMRGMQPITDLRYFPSLRELTAPAPAFLAANKAGAKCQLPSTIERIGIIDTMTSTYRYVAFLLENQALWPGLKEVALWQDIWREPFFEDQRLLPPDLTGGDGNTGDGNDDSWKEKFKVSEDGWGKLEGAGIRVVRHLHCEREGWRG